MSRKATLYVDDRSFNVLECEYQLSKPTDYIGNPTGEAPNYRIRAQLEATGDHRLQQWARSDRLVKSGHIVFILSDDPNAHRTLYFLDAYCSDYRQVSAADDEPPPVVELQLIPEKFTTRVPEGYMDLWTPKEENQRKN